MKTPHRTVSRAVGFDMTPMIDIVFQLIIFFLLTGHMVKQEAHMQLALAAAASGQEQENDEQPRVTINVQSDGQVFLGSGRLSAEELGPRLKEKLEESGQGLEVRIRSDRRAPYRLVEPVLLACARAGVWNVTIAVIRPEGARPGNAGPP